MPRGRRRRGRRAARRAPTTRRRRARSRPAAPATGRCPRTSRDRARTAGSIPRIAPRDVVASGPGVVPVRDGDPAVPGVRERRACRRTPTRRPGPRPRAARRCRRSARSPSCRRQRRGDAAAAITMTSAAIAPVRRGLDELRAAGTRHDPLDAAAARRTRRRALPSTALASVRDGAVQPAQRQLGPLDQCHPMGRRQRGRGLGADQAGADDHHPPARPLEDGEAAPRALPGRRSGGRPRSRGSGGRVGRRPVAQTSSSKACSWISPRAQA